MYGGPWGLQKKPEPVKESPDRDGEWERVRDWRLHQLVEAGLDPEDAAYVAPRFDIDVQLVARMLQRGCSSRLVMEIVM